MMRTVYCGQLTEREIGREVILSGWVHSRRDHGGVLFIDLRDRTGLIQIVVNPEPAELFKRAEELRSEYVVQIKGHVRARPEGTRNPNLPTGGVEVLAEALTVFNKAKTPPFEISEHNESSEDVRLKYRYLDLRRPSLQRNIRLRHDVSAQIREFLNKESFLDIETPMLTRSTPEGARDFLVPARLSPGSFYALPQSPQLFKQVLMVSGFDRDYQVARCFRDEDLRADRQPEFTQIDLEMSFADESDIMDLIERMVADVLKKNMGMDVKLPLRRMSYKEARETYGSDKPDLRIAAKLVDVTSLFASTQFERIKANVKAGGAVKALLHSGGAVFSRKEVDDLTKFAQSVGAQGLAWLKVQPNGEIESPIAKFLTDDEKKTVPAALNAKPGDIVFLVSDKHKTAETVLGALRLHLWNLYVIKGTPPSLKEKAEMLWVTDFPLFEWSDEDKRWVSVHHPFTTPRPEDIETLKKLDAKAELQNPEFGFGNIPRARLRFGFERNRARRRQHSYPRRVGATHRIVAARTFRRGDAGQIRISFGRARVRRASARRHRVGARPFDRVAERRTVDPRRDRVSENGQRNVSRQRRAGNSGTAATKRIAHRGDRAASHRLIRGHKTAAS